MNPNNVEPVKEILSKVLFGDFLLKRLVRRRNNTYVRLDGCVSPNARKLSFLQDPQYFALNRQGHISNLVQKKRAPVALLKSPDSLRGNSGKCPLFVTEQFAFEQVFRNRCAIDRNKRLPAAVAVVMNRPRDQFFAGSALSCNHYRRVTVRNSTDHLKDLLHGLGLADKTILILLDG